jgi:hypothetical protein
MSLATFRRFQLPDLFGADDPAPIARGTTHKVRVLVRNNGNAPILLGEALEDLRQAGTGIGETTQTFELPIGESEVFVLNADQALFAAGLGADITISVHVSEPFTIAEGAIVV